MDQPDVSRRDFLRVSLTSTAGIGLASAAGALPGLLGRKSAGAQGPVDGFPPRVIGLRTMGGNFRFDPAGLRVDPGEDVIWLNMGDFHTASAFHPANDGLLGDTVPLRIPEGAESFHSGMLGMTGGTEYIHRPSVEGVYDYFCQPHYSFGMVGRFIVGAPRGGPAVDRPLSELNEPSREEMPSVESIMGPPGRAFEWSARVNGLLYFRANDRSSPGAASAVREGVESDDSLAELIATAGGETEFRRALEGFLEAYRGDAGYEDLVGLADQAKSPLRAAAEGTS